MPARTQSGEDKSASPEARSAGVRRALLIVLLLNALSVALKAGVGARTGSLTVLGAALESGLDMLSNGVAILAISVAARAPDDDHPYGHGKAELLLSAFQMVLVILTAAVIAWQAALRLNNPQPIRPGWGLAAMSYSIVANIVVGFICRSTPTCCPYAGRVGGHG